MLRNLDRDVPDTTRRTGYQNPVARRDLRPITQRLPGGNENERRRGRFVEAQAFGLAACDVFVDHLVLGIAAGLGAEPPVAKPHLVADPKARDLRSRFHDDARAVAAEDGGERVGIEHAARAQFSVEWIDARGVKPHLDLSGGADLRLRHVP